MEAVETRQQQAAFAKLSGLEFVVGGAIVIAHNVFHLIWNEVPILVILGLASSRIRNGRWLAFGFERPASWPKTIALAFVAAIVRLSISEFLIEPWASRSGAPEKVAAGAEKIAGNLQTAILALAFVWAFAAFGEEFSYRGYLLNRFADAGKRSAIACWAGVVVVSVLFGFGHFYKGPAGIVDSGLAGLILGSLYMFTGRNMWASIIAHGLIDSTAVVILYLGLQS